MPLDNFWGKTAEQAMADLQTANNPQVGIPDGPADVELAVDPYFPRTIPTVSEELKGRAVHFGGRNRLFLDGHVKYLRDTRTEVEHARMVAFDQATYDAIAAALDA